MREFKDNRSGIIMRSHGYDHSFFEGMQESLIKSEKEEQHALKVFQYFIREIGYLHFTTFDGPVASYSRKIEGGIRIWWSEYTRLQSSTNPKVGDKIIVVHGEIHEEKPLRLCCYEVMAKCFDDFELREIEVRNVIFKDKKSYEPYIEPYDRFAGIKKAINSVFKNLYK